jgi:hypothetical protein
MIERDIQSGGCLWIWPSWMILHNIWCQSKTFQLFVSFDRNISSVIRESGEVNMFFKI